MRSKVITLQQLRPGQWFRWIPSAWYGNARLIEKITCEKERLDNGELVRVYDLKFDAAVVNPPGRIYGILGNTKIRLLPGRRSKR